MEWDAEGGAWVDYVPELNGISTFGETQQQALEGTRDILLAYLQSAEDLQLPIPN
jgi:predicted RNase H-like HicB family nuclease